MTGVADSGLQGYRELSVQWFGVLGAAIAWAGEFGISYAMTAHACSTGRYYLLYAASAVALAVAVAAAVAAYRTFVVGGRAPLADEGTPISRTRFMGILGLLNSTFFLVVIAANALPRFILSPCD